MAGADVIEFTEAQFDDLAANSDIPVLVDFGAEWCIYCKMIEPAIRQIADEYAGRVVIGTVNIDREKSLETRFAIRLIPTTVVLAGGVEVVRVVGEQTKADIVGALSGVLDAS